MPRPIFELCLFHVKITCFASRSREIDHGFISSEPFHVHVFVFDSQLKPRDLGEFLNADASTHFRSVLFHDAFSFFSECDQISDKTRD